MGERQPFKTKLCALYEKGHCPRHSCSFAHGDAELRRFSHSFIGRRDYRGADLRDKLERRRSPLRRFSPRRDVRDQHVSRGHSPAESGEQRSNDRKRHKKQHFDGQSDRSGSVKVSDCTEDRIKNRKLMSFEPKTSVEDQLRHAQAEIDALINHKSQLKINLRKRVQEVESLTSRIEELENQLDQEKEEYERITSKINSFVTAHKRHSRLRDELKRSYELLQRMGDQLASDATGLAVNEDASNINKLSDREINGGGLKETIRREKHSHRSEQNAQFDNYEEAGQRDNRSNGHKIVLNEMKSKREKMDLNKAASEEKLRRRETGFSLPLTSMAAHVTEENIENEKDDFEVAKKTSVELDEEDTSEILRSPFPLPPPPAHPQNAYAQYQGTDEKLDVDAVEDDILDVDI